MDPFVDHNHEPDLGYAQDVVARDICRKYVKTNLQNSVVKEVWEMVKDGIARIWSPDEVKILLLLYLTNNVKSEDMHVK